MSNKSASDNVGKVVQQQQRKGDKRPRGNTGNTGDVIQRNPKMTQGRGEPKDDAIIALGAPELSRPDNKRMRSRSPVCLEESSVGHPVGSNNRSFWRHSYDVNDSEKLGLAAPTAPVIAAAKQNVPERGRLGGYFSLPRDCHSDTVDGFRRRYNISRDFQLTPVMSLDASCAKDEVIVSSVMLSFGFPFPLNLEMARLLDHYDVPPCQLSLIIILIFERAQRLQKLFKYRFGFEEIVRMFNVVEKPEGGRMVQTIVFHDDEQTFYGYPSNFASVSPAGFRIKGKWNPTTLSIRNNVTGFSSSRQSKVLKALPTARKNLDFYFRLTKAPNFGCAWNNLSLTDRDMVLSCQNYHAQQFEKVNVEGSLNKAGSEQRMVNRSLFQDEPVDGGLANKKDAELSKSPRKETASSIFVRESKFIEVVEDGGLEISLNACSLSDDETEDYLNFHPEVVDQLKVLAETNDQLKVSLDKYFRLNAKKIEANQETAKEGVAIDDVVSPDDVDLVDYERHSSDEINVVDCDEDTISTQAKSVDHVMEDNDATNVVKEAKEMLSHGNIQSMANTHSNVNYTEVTQKTVTAPDHVLKNDALPSLLQRQINELISNHIEKVTSGLQKSIDGLEKDKVDLEKVKFDLEEKLNSETRAKVSEGDLLEKINVEHLEKVTELERQKEVVMEELKTLQSNKDSERVLMEKNFNDKVVEMADVQHERLRLKSQLRTADKKAEIALEKMLESNRKVAVHQAEAESEKMAMQDIRDYSKELWMQFEGLRSYLGERHIEIPPEFLAFRSRDDLF